MDNPDSPGVRSVVRRDNTPKSASQPVVAPISPSVVYSAADADALDAQYLGQTEGFAYAREGHPNWSSLAAKLNWMEGAAEGIVTGHPSMPQFQLEPDQIEDVLAYLKTLE